MEDLLEALRRSDKQALADEIASRIERTRAEIQRYGGGHVIVGRVVLEGPEEQDPRLVTAQMEILPEGYFVGPVKDLVRPVGFRMHGYTPVDLALKGLSGPVVYVGHVRLKPLPENEKARVTGRIILEGDPDASSARVLLSIDTDPVNTPSNGVSGRPGGLWGEPLKPSIPPSGQFAADGFSPSRYYLAVSAPGYVEQWKYVTFRPGELLDLGTIVLEKEKRISITYYVAPAPPFRGAVRETQTIPGGAKWKATQDSYGWDLVFQQKGGKILFGYNYAPCEIADLGPGELDSFLDADRKTARFKTPYNLEAHEGHVYLLNQGAWKHWVLFTWKYDWSGAGRVASRPGPVQPRGGAPPQPAVVGRGARRGTAELVRRIEWPGVHLYHTAFSPDSRLYLGGGDSGTLRIWDVATGEQQQELPVPVGLFTPDGKHVLGHNDKIIYLFDLTSGKDGFRGGAVGRGRQHHQAEEDRRPVEDCGHRLLDLVTGMRPFCSTRRRNGEQCNAAGGGRNNAQTHWAWEPRRKRKCRMRWISLCRFAVASGCLVLLIGVWLIVWACLRDEWAAIPGGRERATLVITTHVSPGSGETIIEFRHGETVAKSRTVYGHNPPTDQRFFGGDFHDVYKAITGQTHPEPETLCTPGSILQAIRGAGWSVTEDEEQEEGDRWFPIGPNRRFAISTIRTIRLEREGSGP